MTSLPTIGREQHHLEGRTVRDIVEYSPDQVSEVWCRKIFRQILQSLELQYAMRMPHRAITPDTVVFHDNGEPLLVPSDVPAPRYGQEGALEDELRDDLTALASIVHYAITRELAPSGPLRGRAPDGYSESLVSAVDLCMAPDPAERPRTIEALRDLLGIVALGPAIPPRQEVEEAQLAPPVTPFAKPSPFAAGAPATPREASLSFLREPEPARSRLGAGLSSWQRRALALGGGAVLVAIAVTVFAELRDSGSYDEIALRLPQQSEGAAARHAAVPAPLPLPAAPSALPAPAAAGTEVANAQPAPTASAQAYAEGAMGANTAPVPASSGPAVMQITSEQPQAGAADPAAGAAQKPASGAPAGYRLQILPWGTVYVDGVDRGVSPPIKRLVLSPGHHTIRVTNPNYTDRVLEVDAGGVDGRIAVDFSNDSAQ